MKCKPLVCFGNAYDCKPVIDAFNLLPCDKLRMDYVEYPNNFLEAQKFFLEHDYTHFIYLSPDSIISVSQFNELKKMVEVNDYSVYGPVSNVDKRKYKNHLACCVKLPTIEYVTRNYRWVSEDVRKYLLNDGVQKLSVKFNGLAFCFIKREILEKYKFGTLPFESDEPPIWEKRGGWACDLAFCHYCDFENINIIVDLKIKLNHLRYPGPLLVGIKKPLITFMPFKGDGRKNSPKGKV